MSKYLGGIEWANGKSQCVDILVSRKDGKLTFEDFGFDTNSRIEIQGISDGVKCRPHKCVASDEIRGTTGDFIILDDFC